MLNRLVKIAISINLQKLQVLLLQGKLPAEKKLKTQYTDRLTIVTICDLKALRVLTKGT